MGSGALPYQGLVMTPEEFWSILHDAPEPRPTFFRLYYDDNGMPIAYSMDDMPGNYIEVDADTFARGKGDVRVINGQLTVIDRQNHMTKLRPNHEHGTACHPQDVNVVVPESTQHVKWSL